MAHHRAIRVLGLALAAGFVVTALAAPAPDADGDGLLDALESAYGRDAAVRDPQAQGIVSVHSDMAATPRPIPRS